MDYYHHLDAVRTLGDFEGWMLFYLTAIRDSSIDAYKRAKDIQALQEKITQKIIDNSIKAPATKLRALSLLFVHPVMSIGMLSTELDITYNTAAQIMTDFLAIGFLEETGGVKRGKLFKFADYLNLLDRSYDRG